MLLLLQLTQCNDLSEDSGESGHSQRLFATKFDPSDKHKLLSGGWDGNVKVWDIRSVGVSGFIPGMLAIN